MSATSRNSTRSGAASSGGPLEGRAWRCADSLSLRHFLFLEAGEESPDHSSLTRIRERLPLYVHEQVFAFVLEISCKKKLLSGTQVGVDATTLEANAAMNRQWRQGLWRDPDVGRPLQRHIAA